MQEPRGFIKFLRLGLNKGISPREPVFIVGPPRSGTTMLANHLLGLKGFCGPDSETGYFMLTNPYLVEMSPMAESTWKEFVRESKSKTELFDRAIEYFLAQDNGEFFVEKTPQHCLSIHEILRLWPKAKVIGIIRHPLDCVSSAMSHKDFIRQGRNARSAIGYWRKCAESILEMNNLPGNCLVIRYEDLVRNPKMMAEITSFINGSYREFEIENYGQHKYRGRKGFELIDKPFTDVRIGKWQEKLSSAEVEFCWKRVHDLAVNFKYTLDCE